MTSVGRNDPARRLKGQNSSVEWRNSETQREGQAPPLRDERGNVLQRGTGGRRGPPLRRFYDPVWFWRDRCGFVAVVVAISRRTKIAP